MEDDLIINEIDNFNWGKATIGDVLELCLKCKTQKQATRLLEAYRNFEPKFADQNLGYMFGYCSDKNRKRLYKLFPVNHPVFGSGFGRGEDPTVEEAFRKGVEHAKS